jgi:sugar lactone lactonase YvrE
MKFCLGEPVGIAQSGTDLAVLDASLNAVVKVNPVGGKGKIISDASTGTGPDFQGPSGIAVESGGNLVVVNGGTDTKAVFQVDPASGDRTLISGSIPNQTVGTGPELQVPTHMAVEADGNLVVLDDGVNGIIRVTLPGGDRTIVSDNSTGTGPDFQTPLNVAVEADGNFVCTDSAMKAVVRVDATNGNRTILSDSSTGTGPDFQAPENIGVESDGNIVVTDFSLLAVIRVDPVSGNRTIVSGAGVGTGPSFQAPLCMTVQASGFIAVGDAGLERVVEVDPTNGNRTIA